MKIVSKTIYENEKLMYWRLCEKNENNNEWVKLSLAHTQENILSHLYWQIPDAHDYETLEQHVEIEDITEYW